MKFTENFESELKPSQQKYLNLKKTVAEHKELSEILHKNRTLKGEINRLKEKLKSDEDDTLILQKEQIKINQKLKVFEDAKFKDFNQDFPNIDPVVLEKEFISKMEKLSILEYKKEKLERNKINKEFRKKVGTDIKYGILDIKNM